MWLHMLTEPAWGPQLPASVVPTITYGELHPGSSWVLICLKNMIAHPIVIPTKVIVGKVTPVNQVLPVMLPMEAWGSPPVTPRKTGFWRS